MRQTTIVGNCIQIFRSFQRSKSGSPSPRPPSWRGFIESEVDALRRCCGCNARLIYRDCAPNCCSSVQFQVLCRISPLVDSTGFLDHKFWKKCTNVHQVTTVFNYIPILRSFQCSKRGPSSLLSPLAGFFMDGDLDPVGGFCGWDARLG